MRVWCTARVALRICAVTVCVVRVYEGGGTVDVRTGFWLLDNGTGPPSPIQSYFLRFF